MSNIIDDRAVLIRRLLHCKDRLIIAKEKLALADEHLAALSRYAIRMSGNQDITRMKPCSDAEMMARRFGAKIRNAIRAVRA
jgi:hypothetical protein